MERGIGPERVEIVGKGFNHPIADNASESGRSKNRRVEFHLRDTQNQALQPREEEATASF
jgi:outer membrane protein OmpA-like peptidoglycan-associated protein